MEKYPQKSTLQLGLVHLLILPIAAALLLAGFFFWRSGGLATLEKEPVQVGAIVAPTKVITPTPTPFEFQEMTIPHLRSRVYQSKLGKLEEISSNSKYASYLTSYDSDGLKVNGLLTIPKGDELEKFPAVVFVHGYIPPEEYKTLVNYASYVDYLAKSDLVVFKIDLRGHGSSEGEAGGAYYSEDYVVDTLNAVETLRSADFVDPAKVGLWGHSMAGNVTFRSFVVSQNIPAIVIWAGAGYTYEDLQEYSIQDTSYRPPAQDSQRTKDRQRLRDLYGSYTPGHWFWEQVVPTNYLEGVSGALQINHAVNDNVVSIEYSRNLMKVLDGSNIEHELHEYPTGGHNLTGNTFTQAMQETVNFFQTNL